MAKKIVIPVPVLDAEELRLIKSLTKEYLKFRSPGHLSKLFRNISQAVYKITPDNLKKLSIDAVRAASENAVIQRSFEMAAKGVSLMGHQTARLLISSPDQVVRTFRSAGYSLKDYEYIPSMRSYDVAKVSAKGRFHHHTLAFVEGGLTGAPGLVGIPFNIALSFLLYFRATQCVAMRFGYDVRNDPGELETAAQITMECLAPGRAEGEEGFAGLIGKMMLIGELSALNSSLSKTYGEMIVKGGASLFFVQFRALANKAAKTALEKAGKAGLEVGIFKNLLEQVAKQLPKTAAQRSIPFVSAIIGAGVDTYLINRILIGATLVYHKRFLIEKEDRILVMKRQNLFAHS